MIGFVMRRYCLTAGVIMMASVFWPHTCVLLTLDWHLNGDLCAVLLVLLCAHLFWDILAMGHCVWCAVLLRNVVVFGDVDVVAFLLWDFLALLAIVVRWLAFFPVCSLALLLLLI